MQNLIEIVHKTYENYNIDECKAAFEELFGAENGRYPSRARKAIDTRTPKGIKEKDAPYSALIHSSNPHSGGYGGMSFVIFPVNEGPCLIGLVIGTQGLNPDEEILGRPGHGRKVTAICKWLNSEYGNGEMVAWAKSDPVRTDIDVPKNIKNIFSKYSNVFNKYGRVLYGIYAPTENREGTGNALKAFLDLMFEERGYTPLTTRNQSKEYEKIRSDYFSYLMPIVTKNEVTDLLNDRKFVIIEGPPGTGKTRMALEILDEKYESGFSIQFHPNTTYENFVGGLGPVKSEGGMGFEFAPMKGDLMKAIEEAKKIAPRPYLLHIDEINRADLSKVMGEAIYLFEAKAEKIRKINLVYDFGIPIHRELELPDNLHILGTMNTADRSIAIVDVAIRRRFSFVKLWPQMSVVENNACKMMQEAFKHTISIFVEYAGDDAFSLVPGHSYFLEKDKVNASIDLKVKLIPLLEEYIAQGYVASFADAIIAHMQWLENCK